MITLIVLRTVRSMAEHDRVGPISGGTLWMTVHNTGCTLADGTGRRTTMTTVSSTCHVFVQYRSIAVHLVRVVAHAKPRVEVQSGRALDEIGRTMIALVELGTVLLVAEHHRIVPVCAGTVAMPSDDLLRLLANVARGLVALSTQVSVNFI